jgi:acyl carrier protein
MIQNTLESLLRKHLPAQVGNRLRSDSKLSDLGLDSIRAIDLLIDLEETFGITFPDLMLNAETFRSAATLEEAIRKLRDTDTSPVA